MKTAMQELIDWIKEHRDNDKILMQQHVIAKGYELLEKEKEQIIEAHADGAEDYNSYGHITKRGLKNAEYYYNQTYNQKNVEKCYSFISQIDGKNKKCLKCGKDIFEHYNQNK